MIAALQSTEWIFLRISSTESEQVTLPRPLTLPRRSESENHNLLSIFNATEVFTRLLCDKQQFRRLLMIRILS